MGPVSGRQFFFFFFLFFPFAFARRQGSKNGPKKEHLILGTTRAKRPLRLAYTPSPGLSLPNDGWKYPSFFKLHCRPAPSSNVYEDSSPPQESVSGQKASFS